VPSFPLVRSGYSKIMIAYVGKDKL
jgi:hypothetical protein